MANRYNVLRERIAREFERAKTVETGISAGETLVYFDLGDPEAFGNYELPARFEKFGPFNIISVKNNSSVDIRVYFSADRSSHYTDIQSGKKDTASDSLPIHYARYLAVENLDGTTDISDGELIVTVGNAVDSVELDLLSMGGQLNVNGD